jgi:hypothetical protein
MVHPKERRPADAAERNGFDVLVTTDLNLKYQQNLTARRIAIVVLAATSWPRIQRVLAVVVMAIDAAAAATYVDIAIPGRDS